jgi:site-specific recombinase XerD
MLEKQKQKKSAYILPIRHKAYRPNKNSMYNQRILYPLGIVSDEKNKVWFHCTRHTCATKLGEMGVDEKTALKMTGLTTAKTLKIYNQDIKHLAKIAQNIHFKTACAVPKTKTDLKDEHTNT